MHADYRVAKTDIEKNVPAFVELPSAKSMLESGSASPPRQFGINVSAFGETQLTAAVRKVCRDLYMCLCVCVYVPYSIRSIKFMWDNLSPTFN